MRPCYVYRTGITYTAGTALSPAEYTAGVATITLPGDGATTTAEITFTLSGDDTCVEDIETFSIVVAAPVIPGTFIRTQADAVATTTATTSTVSITDDDTCKYFTMFN